MASAVKKYPRGDRGFLNYGEPVLCTYGTTIEVYESSSADGAHVWLSLRESDLLSGAHAAAHLTVGKARDVAARLLAWADDNAPAPCETCGGTGEVEVESGDERHGATEPCPACAKGGQP